MSTKSTIIYLFTHISTVSTHIKNKCVITILQMSVNLIQVKNSNNVGCLIIVLIVLA